MQSERATGTLSLEQGGEQCSLFFLFGHLFHATGDLGQGEEAVVNALGWTDGNFTFDPRAKLPAEETIKAATSELLQEAERRHVAHAESNGSAPAAVEETEEEGEPELEPATVEAASHPQDEETEEPSSAWTADLGPVRENAVTETIVVGAVAPSAEATPIYGNPDATPLTDLYPLPSGKPIYE